MRWRANRAALLPLVVLAVLASALAPCRCVLDVAPCHEAEEREAHACCDETAGVQAVSDSCCDEAPDFVAIATDVPEAAPWELRGSHCTQLPSNARLVSHLLATTPPPVLPDRTTVLLI